ncbi:glutaredoxin 2 [Pantoea sp. LMR881]|uniref:glutaredoxin 2 n=1 Tax=Pantoea sp. LMR881 TaxID=3014336 RepID=UPI0022AF7AE2|nr:glutaredoxin 2 [Pantoea sp. LMR881]MCZ4061053.1 glutaredoxin 2 [Pantoea sp. LMR881]
MKLYVYDHCPFCTRVRMAFALKNKPVTLSVIMEGDADTPVRLVGKKVVPILEKEDGSHMTESLDIVRYVDGTGTPAFSGQVTPELEAWINDAWPVALKLFIPRFTQGDFPELSTPKAREAYRQREEKAFGDLTVLTARTSVLIDEMLPKLHALVPLLQLRQQTDINDIVLWPLLRCLSIVKALSFPPAVRDYAVRLETRTVIPLLFNQAF